jgi:hypothetical protein
MIAIPLLHNPTDDRAVPYTPVCSRTAIPICLHPAYTVYLAPVAAALQPVLTEVAGLPGAPERVSQVATDFQEVTGTDVDIRVREPTMPRPSPVSFLVLPNQSPGPTLSITESAAAVRTTVGRAIVVGVIGDRAGPAQQAVLTAILYATGVESQPPADAAARRFAALPGPARHAWLVRHLAALRAGQITLAQLP